MTGLEVEVLYPGPIRGGTEAPAAETEIESRAIVGPSMEAIVE
jgi:hypothetical protein